MNLMIVFIKKSVYVHAIKENKIMDNLLKNKISELIVDKTDDIVTKFVTPPPPKIRINGLDSFYYGTSYSYEHGGYWMNYDGSNFTKNSAKRISIDTEGTGPLYIRISSDFVSENPTSKRHWTYSSSIPGQYEYDKYCLVPEEKLPVSLYFSISTNELYQHIKILRVKHAYDSKEYVYVFLMYY